MVILRVKTRISLSLFFVLILNFLLLSSILPTGAQTEIPKLTVGDEFVDSNSLKGKLTEDFLLWNKSYVPNLQTISDLETVPNIGTILGSNITCNGLIYVNEHGLLSAIMLDVSSSILGAFLKLDFLYETNSVTPSNMTLKVRNGANLTSGSSSLAFSVLQNFTMWYLETTQRTVNNELTTIWKYQLGQEMVNPFPSTFPDFEEFQVHFIIYYAPSLATIVKLVETSKNSVTCGEPNFLNYSITEVRLQSLGAIVSSNNPVSLPYIFLPIFFLFYFFVRFILKRRNKNL